MAKSFKLQVYTQEKKVLEQTVTSVSLPGIDGYFGVLADHAPMVAALGQGTLKVIPAGAGAEQEFGISGGFCEVSSNSLMVLADSLMGAATAA